LSIRRYLLRAVVPALALAGSGFALPAAADAEFRCVHPEQGGASRGAERLLDRLRDACPLLSRIVEEFALRDLGEAPMLHDDPVATIGTLAASGDTTSAREHAERALRSGPTRDELKEAVYLMVLNADVPQAIEMTRELSELLIEPEDGEQAMLIEASEG
jgi:alkylhydroperoxidase/carboxymuconolactone decarboxylase family protein YurZ